MRLDSRRQSRQRQLRHLNRLSFCHRPGGHEILSDKERTNGDQHDTHDKQRHVFAHLKSSIQGHLGVGLEAFHHSGFGATCFDDSNCCQRFLNLRSQLTVACSSAFSSLSTLGIKYLNSKVMGTAAAIINRPSQGEKKVKIVTAMRIVATMRSGELMMNSRIRVIVALS